MIAEIRLPGTHWGFTVYVDSVYDFTRGACWGIGGTLIMNYFVGCQ
jgi:hypothetical protein